MATLTGEGSLVRVVTAEQQNSTCEHIGLVTGSESMGHSTSHDLQSAINKARNKVAELGGNAMRIISTSSDVYASTVLVEALFCDFEKDVVASHHQVTDIRETDVFDVLIEGVDDGLRTTKQQDRDEALIDAKLQAIERAGVSISSITTVEDYALKKDWIESKARAVLLPGFQVIDKGYQDDGTYLVILSGKIRLPKEKE